MDRLGGRDIVLWLADKPSLDVLKARFPKWWEETGNELLDVLGQRRLGLVAEHLARIRSVEAVALGKLNGRSVERDAAVKDLVKSRMAVLAMEQLLAGAVFGKDAGPLRFNWWNGFILQKLLFRRDLERKPVSLFWFRFWWRWLPQRRFLMPLVQPKGIYCFFSKTLVKGLAKKIGGLSALEVAAGDGTLTRFLAAEGVKIRAIDNHSWSHAIHYPSDVEKNSVGPALAAHRPEAVICSWPPAGNDFERVVFSFPTVKMYIVIASRHSFAAGNWKEYGLQKNFTWEKDERLSRWVLPSDLDPAVYVFERKPLSN
ncbi:MAG: SAM-dependent methyltransferase [Elusimicrobia bacterium]|nr:SAM-dependent methyltransferase [Elusimicrobiota bacterium]